MVSGLSQLNAALVVAAWWGLAACSSRSPPNEHADGEAGAGGEAGASSADAGAAGARDAPSFHAGPSCEGLSPSCGPEQGSDCCSSLVVPGGTFVRDNGISGDFRATIGDFRLDTYEVTVGRFRKFVAGYADHKPAPGSGRNPNNGLDPGWDPAWDAALPDDEAGLVENVSSCDERFTTFAADDDALPMNCITWFEAYAFCIWDGGRLPTDAELNYAAAGGSEQRVFPWSDPPSSDELDDTRAATFPGAEGPQRVGLTSPQGDGRWGHADLSGNEWEWCQDWYQSYPERCINCANLSHYSIRVIRGGSFFSERENIYTTSRLYHAPNQADFSVGVRCARAP